MIITAIPAGFAAGLFGIGGGLITVPILFYIFSTSGIEPSYLMHLAVGTSFGIIIPTSIVSVMTHHQHKAVDFNIVKGYGIFVATGVILGTILAASLKTKPLILFFTIVVYLLAFYLLFLKEKEKFGCKNKFAIQDNSRNCKWFHICTYGYRRSSNECANFKVLWLPYK